MTSGILRLGTWASDLLFLETLTFCISLNLLCMYAKVVLSFLLAGIIFTGLKMMQRPKDLPLSLLLITRPLTMVTLKHNSAGEVLGLLRKEGVHIPKELQDLVHTHWKTL